MLRHKCLDVLGVRRRHLFLPLALSRQPGDWNLRRIKQYMLRHKCKSIPVTKVTGIFVAKNFLRDCYIQTLA